MLFCALANRKAQTPEEFRRSLKSISHFCIFTVQLGLVTILFGLLAAPRLVAQARQGEFMSGFYTGLGSAVAVASAVSWFRIRKLLQDETALRREYIKATDERSRNVAALALQAAGIVTVIVLYLVLLVAGLFNPALFQFCFVGALGFSVLFLIFKTYYDRKL